MRVKREKHATKSPGNQPSVLFVFDFSGNRGKLKLNLVPSCVLQSHTVVQTEREELKWKRAYQLKVAHLALGKALPERFSRDPTLNMK